VPGFIAVNIYAKTIYVNSPASWQHELKQAFRDSQSLRSFLGFDFSLDVATDYPLLVPRNLALLIKEQGPNGALARQFLPHADELSETGLLDPIGDEEYSKTSQLIHRYDNRALLIPTTVCPVHCRYCFRKNELQSDMFANDVEATLNYLSANPQIEEVIFTGGDPFMLSDEKLANWLTLLATIASIKFVRFHTRFPVILPERLTLELQTMLEGFQERFQILMVVHTNHADEWTKNAEQSVKNFRPQGVRWLSQSVLLKGVNDSVTDLAGLFRKLATLNIEAYYLHHPDQVRGAMHFWLPLEEGRMIWGQLRTQVPGWMLPQYVIDIPGGHGKVSAFNPEGHHFSGSLLNRSGQLVAISNPLIQKLESKTPL
jgi:lysine 2,3-aminomutase